MKQVLTKYLFFIIFVIMKVLLLDIENTVIDDLQNRNFLEDNCERISAFIRESEPIIVTFFTWGWKEPKEIDWELVHTMFDKLGVSKEQRDINLILKQDSVDIAIEAGWLVKEDFDRAIQPGMMGEFGISKLSCFTECVVRSITNEHLTFADATIRNPLEYWLIDDLAGSFEDISWHGGILHAITINPKSLTQHTSHIPLNLPTDLICGAPHLIETK